MFRFRNLFASSPSSPPADGYTLPQFTQEALVLPRQLLEAKTIGEIFEISLPIEVAPLTNPRLFASFGSGMTQEESGLAAERYNTEKFEGYRSVTTSRILTSPRVTALGEAMAIARKYSADAVPDKSYTASAFAYDSDKISHGNFIHFDYPEAMPQDVVALIASKNPTLVLPHTSALNIIGHSNISYILNMRLDDPDFRKKMDGLYNCFIQRTDPVFRRIYKAMQPISANSYTVMSGITIHSQPGWIPTRRICFKHVTHYAP